MPVYFASGTDHVAFVKSSVNVISSEISLVRNGEKLWTVLENSQDKG